MPVLTGIAAILGIERTANKDQAGGYAGLNADSKVGNSELVDGIEGAAFLQKSGGTMTGQIAYTDLYLNMGFQTGIDSGPGGVNAELTFYDIHYPAGKTLSQLIDHGSLAGLGDDDHTQYLLVSGTRAMAGNLNINSNALTNTSYIRTPDALAMLIQYGTTTPSSTMLIGSAISLYADLRLMQGFGSSTCYIKNDTSGTMELHVPSGQKVKVVVG